MKRGELLVLGILLVVFIVGGVSAVEYIVFPGENLGSYNCLLNQSFDYIDNTSQLQMNCYKYCSTTLNFYLDNPPQSMMESEDCGMDNKSSLWIISDKSEMLLENWVFFKDENEKYYGGFPLINTVRFYNYTYPDPSTPLPSKTMFTEGILLNESGSEFKVTIVLQTDFFNNRSVRNAHGILTFYTEENQRLSLLESFQQTISNTILNITASINQLFSQVNNHETELTNHESRITALENQTPLSSNFTSPYFKYLSSSDRKNIVCGYAEDNHLTQLTDLGWNCTITYRTLSSGKVSASCRCKKI
ncbi:MAG: hypothetical protein WC584_03750 [Candidatus Pacearchaeota archaeon]